MMQIATNKRFMPIETCPPMKIYLLVNFLTVKFDMKAPKKPAMPVKYVQALEEKDAAPPPLAQSSKIDVAYIVKIFMPAI